MQHQVHGADAEHGGIGIEAMKHTGTIPVGILLFQQFLAVMLLDVFCRFHNEAGSEARKAGRKGRRKDDEIDITTI